MWSKADRKARRTWHWFASCSGGRARGLTVRLCFVASTGGARRPAKLAMAMAEAICDVALPSQEQVAIALAASQQWHSSPAEDFDVSTGREPPAVNVVDEEGLDDACSTVYGQHVSDNLSVEADARHEPLCSEESNENNEGRQRVPVRASSVSDDAHADGSLSCFSTDSDETKSAYQTLLAWSAEGSLDYTEAANSLRHTVEEARGTPSPELEASGESDDDDDDVAHDFQHVGCLPGCHTCSLQVGRNELHVPQCITENGGGPHPTVKRTGISDGDLARAKNNLAADQKVSLSQVGQKARSRTDGQCMWYV